MLRIGPNGKLPMAGGPPPQAGPPQGAGGPPPELLAALAQGGSPDAPPDDANGTPPKRGIKYSIDKVSQEIARYTDPSCNCGNCQFFNPDNTCHVVDGQVDPNGICALHTCNHDDGDNPDDGSDPSGSEASSDGDDPQEVPPNA